MAKKNYGSKKKNRRKEFEQRGIPRMREIAKQERINNATTMEEMAAAMGVKLK